MIKLLKRLVKNDTIYNNVPPFIKKLARKWIPDYYFNEELWSKENPYIGTDAEWSKKFNEGITIGILYDLAQYHVNYMKACHELNINYKVIKFHANNWIEEINESGCELFFVWPSVYNTVWKTMCDERLYILTEKLGKKIYPTFDEAFLYESKKRIRDLMICKNISHPQTWVFYKEDEAKSFVSSCQFPLVFKTDIGASSHGVEIIRNKKQALKIINLCFRNGYLMKRGDRRDKRWGFVIFQEYIPVKHEWRIVRIGETYFSRLKHKKGDFFSGSGKVSWATPPTYLLNRTKEITDQNNFTSIAIDYFETDEGIFLVNEMQAMFGGIEKENTTRNSEAMGYYKLNVTTNNWDFTAGYFYDNACANLRIQWAIRNEK